MERWWRQIKLNKTNASSTYMIDIKRKLPNLSPAQRAQLMRKLAKQQDTLRVVENRSALPLSFSQQRLWFLNQLEPGGTNYNIPRAYRIRGPLDIGALRRSFNEIIRRHESLRTTFAVHSDMPVQAISPKFELEIPLLEANDEGTLHKLIMTEANQPFDLKRGPLIRASIIRLSNQHHVLLFNQHHIISDGWSLTIFLKELNLLYAAFVKGEPSPLVETSLQYADFAVWQQQQQGTMLAQQIDYWKQKLAESPVLELPTDRPRPAVQSYRGSLHYHKVPPSLTHELKHLAQREQATLFMLLMAVFQVLLYRYSNQEDFTVGSPIAGRNRSELEGIIGFFINTLVFRADLRDTPAFCQLLTRVRQTSLEAFTYQEVPFEKLVEEILPKRDMSRNPLFQVMLVLQNTPPTRLTLIDAEVERIPIAVETEKFDLSLSVIENAGCLECTFTYNTDLFEHRTIERMAGHFQNLLQSVVRNPDQSISTLPLLSERERHTLLAEWNDTQYIFPAEKPFQTLFEQQVRSTPDAVALVFENQQLSYGELNNSANQLAHYLITTGAGPETLVGLCLERSLEMVIAILGTLKAGSAYVPLDPIQPLERLACILDDAQIPIVLCSKATTDKLPINTAARQIRLDSDWTTIATGSTSDPAPHCDPASAAYVIYTSGSTGTPKGVVNTQAGICNRLLWMQRTFDLSTDDTVLQKTPYTFDVSVWEFLLPLMAGARLVIAKPEGHKDPAYLAGLIKEYSVTVIHFVPSMLQSFLDIPGLERQCRSLRYLMCSGEALSPELVERYYTRLTAPLHNLYGPTEAAIDVTHWPCPGNEQLHCVPIGKPIANTTIYLLDKWMNPVPAGVAGELYIGGIQVARGYLNRPELTQERFIKDPFSEDPHTRLYRSGDLARYLPDGNIEYLGRIDFQVKLRGFRIELGEIESVLRQQSAVKDCVVIVREDVPGDQRLTAYVIPQHDDVDIHGLKDILKAKLPEYMVPSDILCLDAFPLTSSGKTDRKALPAPARQRNRESEVIAPRTPHEIQMKHIWTEILSLENIGIYDNFFELGGHSLLATRAITRINRTFGTQLPLRALFEHQTIADLTQVVVCTQMQRPSNVDLAMILENIEALPDEAAIKLLTEKAEGKTQ